LETLGKTRVLARHNRRPAALLSKIESKPEPLIDEYSFAEAPNLPNYPKPALERFKDKVITQPDELRGMDTTIWVVRRKKPSDDPQSILLTLPGVPHPISSVPIATKGKSILHLTDLHFAVGDHRKQHIWKLESEKGAKDVVPDVELQSFAELPHYFRFREPSSAIGRATIR
jgi:hypothetical protein